MAIFLKTKYKPVYFLLSKMIKLTNYSSILRQADIKTWQVFFKSIIRFKKNNKNIIKKYLEYKSKIHYRYALLAREYILSSYLEKIFELAFLWQENLNKEADAISILAQCLKSKILHLNDLQITTNSDVNSIKEDLIKYFSVQIYAPHEVINNIYSSGLAIDALSFFVSFKECKVVILSIENQISIDMLPAVIEKTFKRALIKHNK